MLVLPGYGDAFTLVHSLAFFLSTRIHSLKGCGAPPQKRSEELDRERKAEGSDQLSLGLFKIQAAQLRVITSSSSTSTDNMLCLAGSESSPLSHRGPALHEIPPNDQGVDVEGGGDFLEGLLGASRLPGMPSSHL